MNRTRVWWVGRVLVLVGFSIVSALSAAYAQNQVVQPQVNRVDCNYTNWGTVCDGDHGSGAGNWPKGTRNGHIFNSGSQFAGIIGSDGGPWAGDTAGSTTSSFIGSAEPLGSIYSSTDADLVDEWPEAARVPAAATPENPYAPVLRGRIAASDGDVWSLIWDGGSTSSHSLGVATETRVLAWNYPVGNEDILYVVFTFYNITSTNPTDYALVRPAMRETLLDHARRFQQLKETKFGISLPDGGYTITNFHTGLAADVDLGSGGDDLASVNLPFALGYGYDSDFGESFWRSDHPLIFSSPFFRAPGFVGFKQLTGPDATRPLQLFSGAGFPGGPPCLEAPRNSTAISQVISARLLVIQRAATIR